MNRFAVWQQDDPQVTASCFRNPSPPPNPSVVLNFFLQRRLTRAHDPRVFNGSAVGPGPHGVEVSGGLHV